MYILVMLILIVLLGALTLLMAAWLEVHWHSVMGVLVALPIVLMLVFKMGFGVAFVLSVGLVLLALLVYRRQVIGSIWQRWQAMEGTMASKVIAIGYQTVQANRAFLYGMASKIVPSKVALLGPNDVLLQRVIEALCNEDYGRATAIVNRLSVTGRQALIQAMIQDTRIGEATLKRWHKHAPKQSLALLALCHMLAAVNRQDNQPLIARLRKRLHQYSLPEYELAMLVLRSCAPRSDKIVQAYRALHKIAPFNVPAMLLVLERLSAIADEGTAKKLIQSLLKHAASAPQVYLLPIVWQLHRQTLHPAMVNKCWLAIHNQLPAAHKDIVLNYFACAFWLLGERPHCVQAIHLINANYYAPAWQFGRSGLAMLGPEYAIRACLKYAESAGKQSTKKSFVSAKRRTQLAG